MAAPGEAPGARICVFATILEMGSKNMGVRGVKLRTVSVGDPMCTTGTVGCMSFSKFLGAAKNGETPIGRNATPSHRERRHRDAETWPRPNGNPLKQKNARALLAGQRAAFKETLCRQTILTNCGREATPDLPCLICGKARSVSAYHPMVDVHFAGGTDSGQVIGGERHGDRCRLC